MRKILVKGKTQGKILKSENPINFLGSVDKKTSVISDAHHDLFKKSLKNSILVFPSGVGSVITSYSIHYTKLYDLGEKQV